MMKNRFDFTFRCLLALVFTVIFAGSLFAGSAQWDIFGTGDWNTATNWTPATVPNGPADTATFDLSGTTSVSLSANTEVNGIIFNPTASAYTITASPTFELTISGVGITNNSALTQNFVVAVDGAGSLGAIAFENSATAGNFTTITNDGAVLSGREGANLFFEGSSSAGGATINNNAGTVSGAGGGQTDFQTNASAGSATINNNGAAVSNAQGGETYFEGAATAANATINNNGDTFGGNGPGVTLFDESATAGSATISNNAGTANGAAGGITYFDNSSTAGSATITNNAGTVSGEGAGLTEFNNTSTAGSAAITNNGGTVNGAGGGSTIFHDTSIAGNGTFMTNAGTVSGAGGGRIDFFDSSTASHGMFITNGGTVNGAIPGVTDFHNSSSADHGTFTTNGGSGLNAAGGQTEFFNSSTANNATLTANAGTVIGAFGGFTAFWDTSAANSATLIANGGPGQGGGIFFFVSSTGDTSRVEVFGNGFLDISDRALATPNVTVGSIEGTGNVFLGSHNLSVGSNNLSTIFSGVIQDGGENGGTGGSLTKVGTGTLIMSGGNTYTGVTHIDGGVLQIDGSIVSSTTVDPGGTLAGSGLINASASNNGIISPGSPGAGPGTLTIVGTYDQTNSATLRIDIGGLAPAQHDLLAVDSSVTLAGTLQLVRLNNFTPVNGDQVIIMTHSAINNSGQFFPVTDNFPGLIRPQVFYDTSDVRVVFALLNSFSSQALTPNQKSVAHNIDSAVNDPAAAALIGFLGNEPMGNLPHDYDLIAPEELASIYEIGFSQAVVQNDNLQRRMDDIRAGSNGFCANGFVPQVSGKDYTKDSDGKGSLPDKSTRDVYTPAPDNRWGVFVTGTGDFVNVGNDDSNAPGYDITTGDVTVGADYRLCNNFAIGIDAGYSRSTADLVDDGRVDVDGGKVGAYATVFGKGLFGSKFYVDGAVGGGFNSYDTRRTGLQDELVRGSTDGSEFNAMISYGSDWTFGCLTIGTWSSVQYTNVSIDQFTETGSLAPLIIQDQDENSFRTTTGLHASYDIKAGHFIFRPEVRAGYQHEYCDSAYQVDSQLASGAGGVFRVRGPDIGRDSALVGTGMNMQWNNRFSTYVYYDGVLGRNNYDNNAVSGGLRIGF